MIKKISIYIGIILFATSCYRYNKPEKPKNLLSKNEMVNILIDIRLISSANGSNKKTLEKYGVLEESYIYKKYNIDSLQFATSNAYYSYFIEDYEAIYTKVKDSLEALKKKYDALVIQERKEKNTKDSLNKIKKPNKPLIKKDPIREGRDSIRKREEKARLIKPISDL